MAWKKNEDNFFNDNNDDELYSHEDKEVRRGRKKETAARWSEDESRALLKLIVEGKIDFSKTCSQASANLKALQLKFPGRSDKVLRTHFGQLKAKALTAKSKSGARKRDAGTYLVKASFLSFSWRCQPLTL